MTADALLIPTLPVDPDPAPVPADWSARITDDGKALESLGYVLAHEVPLAELRERGA